MCTQLGQEILKSQGLQLVLIRSTQDGSKGVDSVMLTELDCLTTGVSLCMGPRVLASGGCKGAPGHGQRSLERSTWRGELAVMSLDMISGFIFTFPAEIGTIHIFRNSERLRQMNPRLKNY